MPSFMLKVIEFELYLLTEILYLFIIIQQTFGAV